MYNDLNEKIADLICRSLFGISDERDAEKLQEWIDCSEENRRMYEELRSGKSMDEFIRNFGDITGEDMITGIRHTVRKRNQRRLLVVSSSAACVMAAAVIAMWNPAAMPDHSADTLKTTGPVNAILAMSDGKQITLSENEQDSKWQDYLTPIEESLPEYESAEPSRVSITVPRGNKFRIELTDGTKIWLNEESRFEYPDRFGSGDREVSLIGEAYFDVSKDSLREFVVYMEEGVSVKVLGTKFNIRNYSDMPQIGIALIEGSVEVAQNGGSVVLKPNQTATIISGQDGIRVDAVQNACDNIDWIYGLFEFNSQSLRQIADELARWYGLETDYDRYAVRKFREVNFHAVRHENYDKVFSSLATITGLNVYVENRTLIIRERTIGDR